MTGFLRDGCVIAHPDKENAIQTIFKQNNKKKNMKDKKLAETICNVWNEHHTGTFEQTDTNAEIEKWCGGYEVKISPALHNDGETFHHAEALADVCRAFNVQNYLCVNRFGEIIAYIN